MAKGKDMDEHQINDIVQEEKKLLKDDRVYVVLQLDEENKELFSMFCLDTTKNDPTEAPNVIQVVGRGLTDLLSHDLEGVLDLGYQGLERDKQKDSNIVWLDSYRSSEEKQDPTVITFAFKDEDNEDEKDE